MFFRVGLFTRIQDFKLKNLRIKYFFEWKMVKILITKHFFFNLSNNFSAKIMFTDNSFSQKFIIINSVINFSWNFIFVKVSLSKNWRLAVPKNSYLKHRLFFRTRGAVLRKCSSMVLKMRRAYNAQGMCVIANIYFLIYKHQQTMTK